MSRRAAGVHDNAAESQAGGVVLRTLADHRGFTLTACCETCERYAELNDAVLAERFGWNAMLDELCRRVTCRRCGRRTGRVLLAHRRPALGSLTTYATACGGGAAMSERNDRDSDGQEPIRVETREQFDEAVRELFRTGRAIEAPSLDDLAAWDVDFEDDEGAIEEGR